MQRYFRKLASQFLPILLVGTAHATEKTPLITPDHVQAIYRNLVESHYAPETGLFISFVGTRDRKLMQQSSTYDQAVVGMLALRLGDEDRARGILRFFQTAWADGPMKAGREGIYGLANFYNAEYGGAGIEKTIHVGPNAWAGLFAAYMGNLVDDKEATAWAIQVARWIAQDVAHNRGGVAMGPIDGSDDIPWTKIYSTENNISYYAFLNELLRTRDLSGEDKTWLTTERNQVENWLVKVGFDKLAYTMNRGAIPSGIDRTRALDTVTWLISAVGPERLAQRGIDPTRLMDQAMESFEVNVKGLRGVDPTDQPEAELTFGQPMEELIAHGATPRPHTDDHRMIWYEGLGQYMNALNTMAAYHQKRAAWAQAGIYAKNARGLIQEYDKAALKHYPANAAYPYSTPGKFFHDGWYPPLDSAEGHPSSLVAGAWRCFAGLGMDPLAGSDIPGIAFVQVSAPEKLQVTRAKSNVLFGTSEDMVVKAWEYLADGDEARAIQQAQATIEEWSPWALKLQEKKSRKIGGLVEYMGMAEQRKEIFGYWALNDVAAAYFVLGKAADQKRDYALATTAFQQIAMSYSLAQIWDPRGWFWSPLESIRDEYAVRHPRYAGILPPKLAGSTSHISN